MAHLSKQATQDNILADQADDSVLAAYSEYLQAQLRIVQASAQRAVISTQALSTAASNRHFLCQLLTWTCGVCAGACTA